MLRGAGIKQGWRVLDAGCGGGVTCRCWPSWWGRAGAFTRSTHYA
jgi:hypothetical protein